MLWTNRQELEMKILRLPQVMGITGMARPTIYKYIALGGFPRQISLGSRSVGWVEEEIREWLNARISLRDEKYLKC